MSQLEPPRSSSADNGLRLRVPGLGAEGPAVDQLGSERAFRLNMVILRPYTPTPGAAQSTLRERLLSHLTRLCDQWDTLSQRFMQRYFAFLERQIDRDSAAIDAHLARFRGLYSPQDTFFSAPAPLPRANVFLPNAAGSDPIPVDVAFWLGGSASVALASPPRLTPKQARVRVARLEESGIRTETFEADASDEADDRMFTAILGPQFSHFYDSEPLPRGPVQAGLTFVDT